MSLTFIMSLIMELIKSVSCQLDGLLLCLKNICLISLLLLHTESSHLLPQHCTIRSKTCCSQIRILSHPQHRDFLLKVSNDIFAVSDSVSDLLLDLSSDFFYTVFTINILPASLLFALLVRHSCLMPYRLTTLHCYSHTNPSTAYQRYSPGICS